MASQQRLWKAPTLPCSFGETGETWHGPHHCHRCDAYVREAVEYMRLAFNRGEYDDQGYTPNERRAQVRRRKVVAG